ncbi:MAG: GNAT family N-acetyltransferase [Eubacterium sp.]|mgnify:FL=1|nr:GNAT family N-acetyltransferase [Eubacterium sp.]
MKFFYETDRLLLKILDGSNAGDILRFYLTNREIFEHSEASRPENFYTESYQQRILNHEFHMCIKQTGVRFWIYKKTDPDHVIGTVCFRNIMRHIYQSCEVGYKFDPLCWHHGYASEALYKCIQIAFYEMNLHRITAHIMPDNTASIHLAERTGFEREGIARKSALIQGVWEDHIIYSIIHP